MVSAKWKKNHLYIRLANPVLTPIEKDCWYKSMADVMYFYYDIAITSGTKVILKAEARDFPKMLDLPAAIDHILQLDMETAEGVNLQTFTDDDYTDGTYREETRTAVAALTDTFEREYGIRIERKEIRKVREIAATEDTDLITLKKEWTEYILTIEKPVLVLDKEGILVPSHTESVTIKELEVADLIRLKEMAVGFCEAAMKHDNQLSIGKGKAS